MPSLELMTLEEIRHIKESKKRRRNLSKIFGLVHNNLASKVTSANMILYHNEYSDMFKTEFEKISNIVGISLDEGNGKVYEISLWKLIRDGVVSYIDIEKELFITKRVSDFTLMDRFIIMLGDGEVDKDVIFKKLELPMIYYPKYELMLKYMVYYKRIAFEENRLKRIRVSGNISVGL